MKRALIFAALLAAYLGCAATAFAQQIGSYPYAATPLLGTEQMVGNQAAKYPCVGCTVTITPAMIAGYTVGLAPAYGLVYNNNGAPAGIIPSAAGQYCLDWPSTTSAPTLAACSSSMVYPGAGIPISTGTAWGTSYATTGSGDVVLSTSPTLTTPNLGTPSALTLTNATGLPLSTGVTGLLPVADGGTGTATPSLVAGTNVTISGTWPDQTINASGSGGSGSSAFSALTSGTNAEISAPVAGTATTATTGGSLPASTTYYFVITATNANGQTTISGVESVTTGSTTATNTVTPTWTAPAGATGQTVWMSTATITASETSVPYTTTTGSATSITIGSVPTTTGTTPTTNTTGATMVVGTGSTFGILGSSTGYTSLASANTTAANFIATLPANTGTLAETNLDQSWSGNQTFSGTLTFTGVSTESLSSCLGVTTAGLVGTGACSTPPTIPNQTLLGNGSGATAAPAAVTLAGGLTIANGALSISEGVNDQIGTSYTLQVGDSGKQITFDNSGSVNVTLPPATGSYSNAQFDLDNFGAGPVIVTAASLGAPVQAALTTASGSGSLAESTTYYVAVTATNGNGQTVLSNVESIETSTSSTSNTITASVTSIPAATGYTFWISTSTITSGEASVAYVVSGSPTYTFTAVPTNTATTPTTDTSASTIDGLSAVTLGPDRQCGLNGGATGAMWHPIGCTALATSMFSIANASGQATATTNYYGDGISSSTDAVGDVLPQAALFTEMTYYQATAAAGSGTTVTFYSGAPGALAASTALTCTVAVGANSCSVSELQSVAADDMWLVGVDNAGTASTGAVSIGLSYQ